MAEMSQENAMNMKDMQLAMEGISLASRQSAAALEVSNKELKTLTDLMPELTAQIMSVPESHAEAGNKLVEQSSAQFQNLANSFATSMANMMKTITNSAGGSYSSSVKSYSTASGTSRTYASGGYTGDGAKYEERGSVHAGEYVIPQEGVPVVRGTDPASLDELKGIRKALEKLVSMGLYNVNATVYTSEKSVNARDLNPVDELFRTM